MTRVDPSAKTATLSSESAATHADPIPALLVVLEGEPGFQYRAIPVSQRVEIGRATKCALSLADPSASRCHATLILHRWTGNVRELKQAADALGIHRAQLYRVLQKNRLSSDDFRRS